jgi:hypothetical protein
VVHTCNSNYSGGRDQEDHSLKPALANGSWDPITKLPNTEMDWQSGPNGSWLPSVQTLVLPKLWCQAAGIFEWYTWSGCIWNANISGCQGPRTLTSHELWRCDVLQRFEGHERGLSHLGVSPSLWVNWRGTVGRIGWLPVAHPFFHSFIHSWMYLSIHLFHDATLCKPLC